MWRILLYITLLTPPILGRCAVYYIVVPNGLENTNGNDSAQLPFQTQYGPNAYYGPMRYQQVYHASQFFQLPPGGSFVSRIFLRPDCLTSGSMYFSNVVVRLSTTTISPDHLNATFSQNNGRDETVVFQSSSYAPPVESLRCPDVGIFSSVHEINLETPFYYDPAKGHLLIEIQHSGSPDLQGFYRDCRLDAHNVTNDGISRIVAYSRNATNAALVNSSGLVTRFEFFDTPTLSISAGANGVDLYWLARSNVFRLQTSSNFSTGTQWNDIPGGYGEYYFDRQVTIPFAPSQPPAYFRLIWQGPLPNP